MQTKNNCDNPFPDTSCDQLLDKYVGSNYDMVRLIAENMEKLLRLADALQTDTGSLFANILKLLGHNIVGSFETGFTLTKYGEFVTYKDEVYYYNGHEYPYISKPDSTPNSDFTKGYRGSVTDWNAFDRAFLEYAGINYPNKPDSYEESLRIEAFEILGIPTIWRVGKTVNKIGTLVRFGNINYEVIRVPATMGSTPDEEHFKRVTVDPDDVVPGIVDTVKLYRDQAKASELAAAQSAVSASASNVSALQAKDAAVDAQTHAEASKVESKESELAAKTSETNAKQSEVNAKASQDATATLAQQVRTDASDVTIKHADVVVKHGEVKELHADLSVALSDMHNQVEQANISALKAEEARDRAEGFATAAGVSATDASSASVAAEQSKITATNMANNATIAATNADGFRQQAGNYAATAEGSADIAQTSAANAKADADRAALEVGKIGTAVSDATTAANIATAAATRAETAATTAESAKANVEANANKAEASATNAKASEDSARTSATTAESAKEEVLGSVAQATNAATEAKAAAATTENNAVRAETAQNAAISSATNASNSATSAKDSEIKSLDYRDKCQEIYDGIKGGVVVMGTWDASTGAFPAKQATSARWDVIVSVGSEAVVGGFTWHNGDTLYYDKATDEFTQTKGSASVTSVNGRTGAVVLTADDIGAVKKTGDTMSGKLTTPEIGVNIIKDHSGKQIYYSGAEGNVGNYIGDIARWARVHCKGALLQVMDESSNIYPVYHKGFKPTWNDVGGGDYWNITSGDHQQSNGKWIRASDADRGFIPSNPATGDSAKSFLGNSAWWFKEAWVNSYRGGSIAVNGKGNFNDGITLPASKLVKFPNGQFSVDTTTAHMRFDKDSKYYTLGIGNDGVISTYNSKLDRSYKIFHEGYKPISLENGQCGIYPEYDNEINFASRTNVLYLNHRTKGSQRIDTINIGNGDSNINTYGHIKAHNGQFFGSITTNGPSVFGSSITASGDVIANRLESRTSLTINGSFTSNQLHSSNRQLLAIQTSGAGTATDDANMYHGNPITIKAHTFETKAGGKLQHYMPGAGTKSIYSEHNKPTLDVLTGTAARAAESSTLNGKTAAQIINEARSGLVTTANVYTKSEADNRFLLKSATRDTSSFGRTTYSDIRLSTQPSNSEAYLRKFRGGLSDTIWHETVQGSNLRWYTGDAPSTLQMELNSTNLKVKGLEATTRLKNGPSGFSGNIYLSSVSHQGIVGKKAGLGFHDTSPGTSGNGGLYFWNGATNGSGGNYLGAWGSEYFEAYTDIRTTNYKPIKAGGDTGGFVQLIPSASNPKITIGSTATYLAKSGETLYVAANGTSGKVMLEGKVNPQVRIPNGDFDIYHKGNKPLPNDIGAISKDAYNIPDGTDVVQFFKTCKSGLYKSGSNLTNLPPNYGHGDFLVIEHGGAYRAVICLDQNNRLHTLYWNNTVHSGWSSTYSTSAKPTASDIGALDTTWFSTSGEYPHFAKNSWLRANGSSSTIDGGFLPYKNGSSYLGTSGWRFNQSWVNSYYGNYLNLSNDASANNFQLKGNARQHITFFNTGGNPVAYIWKDPDTNFLTHTANSRFEQTITAQHRIGLDLVYSGNDGWIQWHKPGVIAYGAGINSNNVWAVNQTNGSGGYLKTLFYVDLNANFTALGNITAYSDIRVKDNIEPIANALDKVTQLTGYTYTRTDLDDKDKRYTGLIAQEVEKVLPEAVTTDYNRDSDIEDFKSVAYGNVVGLLVEAIKELKTQNQELLARIEVLENGK